MSAQMSGWWDDFKSMVNKLYVEPYAVAYDYWTSPKTTPEKVWRDVRYVAPMQEAPVRAAIEKEMVKADIARAELAAVEVAKKEGLPTMAASGPAPQVPPITVQVMLPSSMTSPAPQASSDAGKYVPWILGVVGVSVLAFLVFRKKKGGL